MNLGSGLQGEFTFMDLLGILSFLVGIQNLNENLTQNDKSDLQHDLAQQTKNIIGEIHQHLEEQDKKLDYIIQLLNK
jgi:hypothetical protein